MTTTVREWSGYEAKALRAALRLTIEDFADRLGVSTRTVAKWEARGRDIQPKPDTQAILDTALAQATEEVCARFAAAVGDSLAGREGLHADHQFPDSDRDRSLWHHPKTPGQGDVLLPIVVDGRRVLLPLDAAAVAGRGLALAMNLVQSAADRNRLESLPANIERAYELYTRSQGLLATNDRPRVEAASKLLNMALDIDPRFARAQAARGYAQWRQYFAGWAADGAVLQRALIDVDSALRLEPDSVAAHTTLIRICWDVGWHERALEAGLSIYQKHPQSLEATLAYARALNNAGLAELALPLTHAVLEIDPTNPTALKLLIWNYLMVRDEDAALRIARDYLPAYPSDSNTRWAVAVAQLRTGDSASAMQTAEAAIRVDPDNVTVWNLLGYVHRHAGDESRAVAAWSEGIAHFESTRGEAENPRLQSWLANLRAAAGQTEQARTTAAWLTETEPHNGYLKYRTAHVLAELGDTDDAVRLLDESIQDGFRSAQLLRHEEAFALARVTESQQYRRTVESMERRVDQLRRIYNPPA